MNTKKVLIVDDSKLIQSLLREIFKRDPRFQVVGVAADPHEARALIKQTDPDVLTLDVEMPRMNGITFLKNLMRLRPMPVVMISTLTAKGAAVTLDALEIGAINFIQKPSDLAANLDHYAEFILSTVYEASLVSRLKLLEIQQRLQQSAESSPNPAQPINQNQRANASRASSASEANTSSRVMGHRLCAVGGSTGGLEALSSMLKGVLFNGRETIVVCLHLPAGFTQSFANRLNAQLPIDVKEAEQGEMLLQGCVYIAPGGHHMEVAKHPKGFQVRLNDNDPVNRHRPSVDVLFNSVANEAGASSMGIILTGMGSDGANGLLNMAKSGCITYAQDETTAVVWGMPGSAVKLGAVIDRHVLPLHSLSQQVNKYYRQS